jgi:type IV secretion system protein VirD4
VLQDFSQLKTHYPNSWETFLGNAGIIQAFGNTDLTTTEYLSKLMGQTEIVQRQQVWMSSHQMGIGDAGVREQFRSVPLLAPDELAFHFARETNRQLLLLPGHRPVFMERMSRDDFAR